MRSKVIRQNVSDRAAVVHHISSLGREPFSRIQHTVRRLGKRDLQASDIQVPCSTYLPTIGNCAHLYQKASYDLYMSSESGVEPHYRFIRFIDVATVRCRHSACRTTYC
jgi:hypothetical protein